jgi:hypothetical protein
LLAASGEANGTCWGQGTACADRQAVDLERGIFYRKAIGKRATKKRQTPAPVPPRLLIHMRRWKDRKLFANCFVEFNGKPVV